MLLHGDIGRLNELTTTQGNQDVVTFVDGVAYRAPSAVITGAQVVFTEEQSSLANGSEIDSGFIDYADVDKVQVTYKGDATGLTLVQEGKFSLDGSVETITAPLPLASSTFSIPLRFRFARFRFQNNTGSAIANVGIQVKTTFGSSDKTSVFALAGSPVASSQAQLTQSVIFGQDPFNNFVKTGVNQAGALLQSEFDTEVARGLYSGYETVNKFGRNPDIDTGTTPEDIYNGGSLYTGFNATANEEISITSADVNDRGSLLSSGTATGGSATTIIDTGATFIDDSVSVGDLVINDTQGIHGIITSVDSQTQLTVFQMVNGADSNALTNVSGDAYRIATSIDTGAAVLRLSNVLDSNYVRQTPVYVILNGTTTVTTSGVTAMRCDTGRTVLAGSSGRNEGEITVTQAVSTSNVFCVIPTFGSTTIGCATVPAGFDAVIKKVEAAIVRSTGAAGSATIALNVRKFGQGFTAERVYELQTGSPIIDELVGGIVLPPGTDFKGTVEVVSDNNTVAQINIDYFLIARSS